MINWLQLTDDQRRTTLNEAALNSGIKAKAIEKDWWVTLTLKALFQGAYAQFIVFKGGTSLSKCWNLIERFSEDIDISLAPEAFGKVHEENPSGRAVIRLRTAGREFTDTLFKTELETQLDALGLPAGKVTITAAALVDPAHPEQDPQTLLVKYESLYEPNPYIADEVKIEVGVRSLLDPNRVVQVQSLLTQYNPNQNAYPETTFAVTAVEARKTFIEKTFLLHEEFSKADRARIRSFRMSRHLADLGKMLLTNVESEALGDHELYDHLIIHRERYQRFNWFDYKTLAHTTITFIPSPDVIERYREDYATMREEMIYGESLEFDELIERLTALQGRFRTKKDPPKE
jgi:hypothetical protein